MVNLQQIGAFLGTKEVIHKIIAYTLLILAIYFLQGFLFLFFLTFIFSYLFLSSWEFLKVKIDTLLKKRCSSDKTGKKVCRFIPLNLVILIEYIVFLTFLVFIFSSITPKLVNELWELPNTVPFLADQVNIITDKVEEVKTLNSEIGLGVQEILSENDIDVVVNIWEKIKSFGVVFLQVVLAFILSFIFIVDRERLKKYLLGIKKSSFNFLYKEYKIIFDKIIKSFGIIFKAQATIAFVNAVLTTIGLIGIGLIHGWSFPYLLTLALIVFICGFIPVLWVFISSIPILFVAYSIIGGYTVVIEIILLIAIVHVIEAYYLNPKIVSRFIEVPMSLTFIILIISEHFFWIAWLLIGISCFYFFVGVMQDINKNLLKNARLAKKQ